jgi:hypothetical protein
MVKSSSMRPQDLNSSRINTTRTQNWKSQVDPRIEKTQNETICSKVRDSLGRSNVSALQSQDIQSLLSLGEVKCPQDVIYLNKIYEILLLSEESKQNCDKKILESTLNFKNSFNEMRKMLNEVKHQKNRELEQKENQYKKIVNDTIDKSKTICNQKIQDMEMQIQDMEMQKEGLEIERNYLLEELEKYKSIPLKTPRQPREVWNPKTPRKVWKP